MRKPFLYLWGKFFYICEKFFYIFVGNIFHTCKKILFIFVRKFFLYNNLGVHALITNFLTKKLILDKIFVVFVLMSVFYG